MLRRVALRKLPLSFFVRFSNKVLKDSDRFGIRKNLVLKFTTIGFASPCIPFRSKRNSTKYPITIQSQVKTAPLVQTTTTKTLLLSRHPKPYKPCISSSRAAVKINPTKVLERQTTRLTLQRLYAHRGLSIVRDWHDLQRSSGRESEISLHSCRSNRSTHR